MHLSKVFTSIPSQSDRLDLQRWRRSWHFNLWPCEFFKKHQYTQKTMDTIGKKIYILQTWRWATVAQLVEHLTRNEDVCGSTPHGGSSKINMLWAPFFFFPEKVSKLSPFSLKIVESSLFADSWMTLFIKCPYISIVTFIDEWPIWTWIYFGCSPWVIKRLP